MTLAHVDIQGLVVTSRDRVGAVPMVRRLDSNSLGTNDANYSKQLYDVSPTEYTL